MRLRITLGELPWEGWNPKGDPAHLTKLRQRLHELFAAYGPKRLSEKPTGMDYCKHEMTVAADDPAVEKLLEAFDKEVRKVKPNVAGMVEAELSPDEVPRARWLERPVLGDRVDVDAKGKPTNAAESVLCTACGFPDIGRVPEPFRVAKAALKKQDVLATSRGVLVVRPDALALLSLAPAALHLATQVVRADPDDGDLALRLFRSNRSCGFLVFLAMLVVGLSAR